MPNKLTLQTRKHSGIIQTGGNVGRLKKGFRYSGLKLKSGLPQIVKTTKKTTKRRKQRGGKKINQKYVLLTLTGKSKKGSKKQKGGVLYPFNTAKIVVDMYDNLLVTPNKFIAETEGLFQDDFYKNKSAITDETITIDGKRYRIREIKDGKFKDVLEAFKDARDEEASAAKKHEYKIVDGVVFRSKAKTEFDDEFPAAFEKGTDATSRAMLTKLNDLIEAEDRIQAANNANVNANVNANAPQPPQAPNNNNAPNFLN